MRGVVAAHGDDLARQHRREQAGLGAGDLLAGEGDLTEGVDVDDAQAGIDGEVGVTIVYAVHGSEDDLGADGDASDDHAATLPKRHEAGVAERSRL